MGGAEDSAHLRPAPEPRPRGPTLRARPEPRPRSPPPPPPPPPRPALAPAPGPHLERSQELVLRRQVFLLQVLRAAPAPVHQHVELLQVAVQVPHVALDLLLLLLLLVDLVCGGARPGSRVAPGGQARAPPAPQPPSQRLVMGSLPTAPPCRPSGAPARVAPLTDQRSRRGTLLALRHGVPRKDQPSSGAGVQSSDPDLPQAGFGAPRAEQEEGRASGRNRRVMCPGGGARTRAALSGAAVPD